RRARSSCAWRDEWVIVVTNGRRTSPPAPLLRGEGSTPVANRQDGCLCPPLRGEGGRRSGEVSHSLTPPAAILARGGCRRGPCAVAARSCPTCYPLGAPRDRPPQRRHRATRVSSAGLAASR